MAQKPTLVILAAGLGTRYGGIKQLDEVGPNGEAIIDYSIYDAYRAGFGKIIFVIREDLQEAFTRRFGKKLEGKIPYEFAYQRMEDIPKGFEGMEKGREKPWGTAHAVWCSRSVVTEPFLAINADDFYGREAYQVMHDALMQPSNDYYMVGYYLKNTLSEHGSVARGICTSDANNYLTGVAEYTEIYQHGDKAYHKGKNGDEKLDLNNIVSMNIWGLQTDIFDYIEQQFSDFLKQKPGPKDEFYIPRVINNLITKEEKQVKILHSNSRWFGITYREDRPHVEQSIKEMIAAGQYPEVLW